MLLRLGLIAFLYISAPALAEGGRDGDVRMAAADLAAVLAGRTLEFFDGSLARYDADRSYQYRYRPQDPPFVGTWDTNDDSEVCVLFDNGFSRCDRIVRAGGRLVLITGDGLRFPVRERRPNP